MVLGLHRHEDRDAEAELVLVDHRDPLLDHAVRLEPLDALPARRRREPDPAADFGNRERGVLLEHGEDFPVDGVHASGPLRPRGRFSAGRILETIFLFWKLLLHSNRRIFYLASRRAVPAGDVAVSPQPQTRSAGPSSPGRFPCARRSWFCRSRYG